LDENIKVSKENISINCKAFKQLDDSVDQSLVFLPSEQSASQTVAIRHNQAKKRSCLLDEIETEQKTVGHFDD
jgi:hypothetical protein